MSHLIPHLIPPASWSERPEISSKYTPLVTPRKQNGRQKRVRPTEAPRSSKRLKPRNKSLAMQKTQGPLRDIASRSQLIEQAQAQAQEHGEAQYIDDAAEDPDAPPAQSPPPGTSVQSAIIQPTSLASAILPSAILSSCIVEPVTLTSSNVSTENLTSTKTKDAIKKLKRQLDMIDFAFSTL